MSEPEIIVLRRPPPPEEAKSARRGKWGRPRKPAAHAHGKIVHARITVAERALLNKIRKARRDQGMDGGLTDSEWIREMIRIDAERVGVPLHEEYKVIVSVRCMNDK